LKGVHPGLLPDHNKVKKRTFTGGKVQKGIKKGKNGKKQTEG